MPGLKRRLPTPEQLPLHARSLSRLLLRPVYRRQHLRISILEMTLRPIAASVDIGQRCFRRTHRCFDNKYSPRQVDHPRLVQRLRGANPGVRISDPTSASNCDSCRPHRMAPARGGPHSLLRRSAICRMFKLGDVSFGLHPYGVPAVPRGHAEFSDRTDRQRY